MTVLCQWCGSPNPDGRELCVHCNSKLLVVSGWSEGVDEAAPEDPGIAAEVRTLAGRLETEIGVVVGRSAVDLDARRETILPILAETYGADDAQLWWMRWRLFFMACAETFGYDGGETWRVGHYLFERPAARELTP